MCLSKPSMPAPVAPPPTPQDVKQPDQAAVLNAARQRNRDGAGMSGGSLLTGPSGAGVAPTGKTTLLGQ